jgi:hypothetical protein
MIASRHRRCTAVGGGRTWKWWLIDHVLIDHVQFGKGYYEKMIRRPP